MGTNFDCNYKHNSKHGAGLAFVMLALAFVTNVGKKTRALQTKTKEPSLAWRAYERAAQGEAPEIRLLLAPPNPRPPKPGSPQSGQVAY